MIANKMVNLLTAWIYLAQIYLSLQHKNLKYTVRSCNFQWSVTEYLDAPRQIFQKYLDPLLNNLSPIKLFIVCKSSHELRYTYVAKAYLGFAAVL